MGDKLDSKHARGERDCPLSLSSPLDLVLLMDGSLFHLFLPFETLNLK